MYKSKRGQSKQRLQEPRQSKQETHPSLKKIRDVLPNLISDHLLPGSLWYCLSKKFQRIHTTVGPVLLRGATETPLSPTGRCHGAVALKSLQRTESKCQGSEQSSTEFIYHFILTKASFRETFYFICHFEIISVVFFLNA